ncbi:sigma-70 family RNA polymerase sigma factor [Stutzerimonas kirkiae]|uniref:RNA polymerase subunit sigma-24 n=1 Tax=Stutzerimonas kirkiae TaxID=2211392 RepID=A0A4Q9R6Y6_9GAMM|nr:sigma-70 family RNA polymerase sigma factor [Stutzerimonas kirkiae]TBU95764.1 RNA polymerase subunit sigma-24 [Stutzerimonas kirkiae]TBV02755.1 RNA polymerase subunit sigma-24 [Stutzerimonas kirkiae]TBV03213.1 RNA polymerase subunit sigma-24 [Stutzerimonas kirkiae]TBV13268.1 RNA polymerase subunit sigma-24 [Stutzerimonas kirkiae]
MDENAQKLQLYLTHRTALVDYATPITGCRAQAEEVVQEAWLRFSHASHEPLNQPQAYLYRIVRNLALDQLRQTSKAPGTDDPQAAIVNLVASTPSPEQQVCQQDELRLIAEALEQLPMRTRIAFEMHRLGGHTLQQIAAHLEISVGLAHQLVHSALAHCSACLDDEPE